MAPASKTGPVLDFTANASASLVRSTENARSALRRFHQPRIEEAIAALLTGQSLAVAANLMPEHSGQCLHLCIGLSLIHI